MTLAEMRNEFRRIVNELTSQNHFDAPQINLWLNEGYRYTLTKLDTIPIKETDLVSAETISLSTRTLTIDTARIKAQPVDEFQVLKIIDIETLSRIDPDWENADPNIPEYLVRMSTFLVRLYPEPDVANTGVTVRTHGMEFPADLALDGDTPDLPLNMHDILPHYAAYRGFSQLGETERSTQELILVNGLLKAQHAITTKFSNRQNRWKFDEPDDSFHSFI